MACSHGRLLVRSKPCKRPQARFALAQRDLGPPALCDIQARAAISRKDAHFIVHGFAADGIIDILRAWMDDYEFEVAKRPTGGEL